MQQKLQQNIITFKNNGGRTGNLIFPYMLCKLIEIKLGNKYVPYSPELEKEKEHHLLITDENIDIEILPKNKNIILNGYFQKSRFFIKDRIELIKRMKEATNDYWVFENKKYYISDFFKETPRYNPTTKDIVISLRLDDFIQYPCPTSDILPPQYYLDILENSRFETLYIICDKLKHSWEYKYMEFFEKWNPIYVIGDTLWKDGALMRDCPIFIHSNSTFSWLMSFFSQNINKKRYIPCTNMYKGQNLGMIELETDIWKEIQPLTHQEVHELDFKKYLQNNIFPLSYSIPDEKIIDDEEGIITKSILLSPELSNNNNNKYKYNATQEKEYYQQYRDAYFAITKKKGGWDCLRHYEILANGCIPLFENLENCPKNTLTTLPKTELIDIIKQRDFFLNNQWSYQEKYIYSMYHKKIMDNFREKCTTSANTKYLLSKLSKSADKIQNVLMLCCDSGVNYLRELSWIGIKRWICEKNGIAVEYPKLSYLYEDYPDEKKKELYGNGFTYSKCLSIDTYTDMDDSEIEKSIENKKWDLIIYGKTGPDELVLGSIPFLPFWKKVSLHYNKNDIIFLYGGDECFDLKKEDRYTKHLLEHAKYGTCFVRELVYTLEDLKWVNLHPF